MASKQDREKMAWTHGEIMTLGVMGRQQYLKRIRKSTSDHQKKLSKKIEMGLNRPMENQESQTITELARGTTTNLSLNSNRFSFTWDDLEAILCKQNFKFRSAYLRSI